MAIRTIIPPASEPVSLRLAKKQLRVDECDDSEDEIIAQLITVAREWCESFRRERFIYQTMRLEMDFFPGYIDSKLIGSNYAQPFASGANAVLAGIRYAIILPYPTVHRIAAFQYLDQNGNAQDVEPGTQYIADLDSRPARLTPPFGQFWPIAQVIANAVRVDFVTGYGANINIGVTAESNAITGYTFVPEDVGSPISISGIAPAGAPWKSTIASVSEGGAGTLAANPPATLASAAAYLGQPVPASVTQAMLMLISHFWNNRDAITVGEGAAMEMPMGVKSLLYPRRDLRL